MSLKPYETIKMKDKPKPWECPDVSESTETPCSISDEVWMIQPKFESKFCLYKNQLHGTCMAKGGDGSKCARNICPCKVPLGPIEYAESLDWGE